MSEPAKPRPTTTGIAFLIIGLIILVPSGLCTGVFAGGAILDMVTHPGNSGDAAGLISMATLVGGPFVLLGGFLVWLGVRNVRRR